MEKFAEKANQRTVVIIIVTLLYLTWRILGQ